MVSLDSLHCMGFTVYTGGEQRNRTLSMWAPLVSSALLTGDLGDNLSRMVPNLAILVCLNTTSLHH